LCGADKIHDVVFRLFLLFKYVCFSKPSCFLIVHLLLMIYTSHIKCRSRNKSWTKNNCRVCGSTWTSEQRCCYSDYLFLFLLPLISRFRVRIGVHQLHFLHFICIGLGCCRYSNAAQIYVQCFCKTDSDELQVNKSGIGTGSSLDVGVGYFDFAEKEYSYPHPFMQQSFIEIFKLPKRLFFLPMRYFLYVSSQYKRYYLLFSTFYSYVQKSFVHVIVKNSMNFELIHFFAESFFFAINFRRFSNMYSK
jgi:hypothetical protein